MLKKIKIGKIILIIGITLFIVLVYSLISKHSKPFLAVVGEINLEKAEEYEYTINGRDIFYNDDKTLVKLGFSGKVDKTIELEFKKVYYGADRVYLVDTELGRIYAYNYKLEQLWYTDLKDSIEFVKEEDKYLYVVKNAGKNFDAVFVLDDKGNIVMQRAFEDERVLEVYRAGKDKFFVNTFRAGNEAIYSNVYLVDEYGKILMQNNYENEVVVKLQIEDEENFIIYTDTKIAKINKNNKVWEETISEDIIDYVYFKDNVYVAYKDDGVSLIKQIDKADISQKDFVTERHIEKLIPFSSILGINTEDGIYYFDEEKILKSLYISDPPPQKILVDEDSAVLIFKNYIQIVKLTSKFTLKD